jgi:hypothetical protein
VVIGNIFKLFPYGLFFNFLFTWTNFDCPPQRGVRTTWDIYVFITIIVYSLSSNITAVYSRFINNSCISLEFPIWTKQNPSQKIMYIWVQGPNNFLDLWKGFYRLIKRNSETVLKRMSQQISNRILRYVQCW